jgi:hypothetical protein
MVHFTTPNGQQFPSYDCWNLARLLKLKNSGQTGHFGMNWSLSEISPWEPWKLWMPKLLLTNSAFWWLLTWSHLMHCSTVTSFQRQVMVLNGSWTGWTQEWNLRFKGLRWVKLVGVWLWILQRTCSTFQHLLIHMISITTAMVTAVRRRQHLCGALADCRNSVSKQGFNFGIDEDYDF